MKGNFFSSIRFRAYVLFALTLALALFFHNALTYFSFKDALQRKIDALLDVKAQAVESTLHAYKEGRKTNETGPAQATQRNWFSDIFGGGAVVVRPEGLEDPYEDILHHLTRNTLAPEIEPTIVVDIYSLNGRLTDTSSTGINPGRLDSDVLEHVLNDGKAFYTERMRFGNRTVPVRAVAVLLSENGRARDIVQARIPLQSMLARLHWLMLELALRSLVVLVLVSGGGIVLVKFTLRPVDRMTRAIRNIKPDSLDKRLPVPDTHDEIARLAETFNELLGRMEKSFRSQRQIVQDISHELKTPLTIIRGQFEVALKKRRPEEEYVEILQSGLEEIQKVRQIVDNLLLLARFDSPGHALEMKSIELKKLLESVLHDTRILCLEKEIDVSFAAGNEVSVHGNIVHLDRLFRNLLENAAKYNVPHGKIDVALEEDRENAWITIRDTGIGIADPEIEKVFDRFYRVDQARSSREGFGLGLSIAKSIVDAHRGRIQVQSAVGQGTTFRVALPRKSDFSFLSV